MSITPDVTRVVMQAETQAGDRREPIAGNPIPMRPGMRLLLILRDGRPAPGTPTRSVDLLSLYDRPPAQPSTAAPDATVPPSASNR